MMLGKRIPNVITPKWRVRAPACVCAGGTDPYSPWNAGAAAWHRGWSGNPAEVLLSLQLRSFGISMNFLPRVKRVIVENSGGGMGAASFHSFQEVKWDGGNASMILTLGKVQFMIPVENPLPFLPHATCSCQLWKVCWGKRWEHFDDRFAFQKSRAWIVGRSGVTPDWHSGAQAHSLRLGVETLTKREYFCWTSLIHKITLSKCSSGCVFLRQK